MHKPSFYHNHNQYHKILCPHFFPSIPLIFKQRSRLSPILEEMENETPEISESDLDFSSELPVLPIRNAVLFPTALMPIVVGRPKTVRLLTHLYINNEKDYAFLRVSKSKISTAPRPLRGTPPDPPGSPPGQVRPVPNGDPCPRVGHQLSTIAGRAHRSMEHSSSTVTCV